MFDTSMIMLQVLMLSLISTTSLSNDCIFNTSAFTLNAASDLALSGATTENNWTIVRFASPALRRIPNQAIDGRPPEFFDALFNRRHNSQSYMWASASNSARTGAALAHLISCTTEMFARSDDASRHSLCVSSVSGDQTSQSLDDRCSVHSTTQLLIGVDNDSNRPNRTGTQACWCETACTTVGASFEDTSNGSTQVRRVNSVVVLEETEELPTMSASVYENGEDGNNRPGINWYQENLVDGQAPLGKGVFPRNDGRYTQGVVLRSLRLRSVVDPISSEDTCPNAAGFMSAVELRTMARVEQEMMEILNAAIAVDLAETPARTSTILLTIASALTAVLVFGWLDTASKRVDSMKKARRLREMLPPLAAIAVVVVAELAIENIPMYFLLAQEIAARDHIETLAVEVIGAGNQVSVLPIVNGLAEEFLDVITALVLITVKNNRTSLSGIVIATVLLSVASVLSICIGIGKRCASARQSSERPVGA